MGALTGTFIPHRIIRGYHLFNSRYGIATKMPKSSRAVYKKPKQIIAFHTMNLARKCCIWETAFWEESAYGVPEVGWASRWQRPKQKTLQ